MASPDGHVLRHGPWVQRICIKASQGMTGKQLNTIDRCLDGDEADLRLSLEQDGRPFYDGRVRQIYKVGLFLAKHVEQALGAMHAIMHAYAGQRGAILEHVQFHLLVNLALFLQGRQEWHHIADDIMYQQIA